MEIMITQNHLGTISERINRLQHLETRAALSHQVTDEDEVARWIALVQRFEQLGEGGVTAVNISDDPGVGSLLSGIE